MKKINDLNKLPDCLLSLDRGIVYINGPSGCGKTSFLKSLQRPGMRREPFVDAYDKLLCRIRASAERESILRSLEEEYAGYEILCWEDADVCLAGKVELQGLVASLASGLAADRVVIVTGTGLARECPVLLERTAAETEVFVDLPGWRRMPYD